MRRNPPSTTFRLRKFDISMRQIVFFRYNCFLAALILAISDEESDKSGSESDKNNSQTAFFNLRK